MNDTTAQASDSLIKLRPDLEIWFTTVKKQNHKVIDEPCSTNFIGLATFSQNEEPLNAFLDFLANMNHFYAAYSSAWTK